MDINPKSYKKNKKNNYSHTFCNQFLKNFTPSNVNWLGTHSALLMYSRTSKLHDINPEPTRYALNAPNNGSPTHQNFNKTSRNDKLAPKTNPHQLTPKHSPQKIPPKLVQEKCLPSLDMISTEMKQQVERNINKMRMGVVEFILKLIRGRKIWETWKSL